MRHCKERLDLRNNCVRMDNDDLNALTIIGSIVCKNVGVCKSNEHGIEGGRAIRVCGRRHSTLAIGVSDPIWTIWRMGVVGLTYPTSK